MGGAVFPPCCLTWGQTVAEVMKIMAASFKSSHALHRSVPPTMQQATVDPHLHWRLLDTHRQVWVSLLWGHCSFLLCPGVHKVLLLPSKILFPQSVKAVYRHPACLTYMQCTSCKIPDWMKHKLESRLPREISITSDMQMTPPLWQKVKKN